MAIDYARLRDRIRGAILLAGTTVALERRTPAAGGDAWDPAAPTAARETGTAVIGEIKTADGGGGLARREAATVTLAARAGMAAPVKGDRVLLPPGDTALTVSGVALSGEWFDITEVTETAPGGVVVIWTLTVVR